MFYQQTLSLGTTIVIMLVGECCHHPHKPEIFQICRYPQPTKPLLLGMDLSQGLEPVPVLTQGSPSSFVVGTSSSPSL